MLSDDHLPFPCLSLALVSFGFVIDNTITNTSQNTRV